MEFGIAVDGIERVVGGRLSRSMIIVEAGGRRTIFNEPLSLPVPKIRDYLAEAAAPGRELCLHLEGYRAHLIDELDLSGAARPDRLTLDTTGLPLAWQTPESFARLRQRFDVVFMSRPVARCIVGVEVDDQALPAALEKQLDCIPLGTVGATIVITMGSSGSAVLTPGQPIIHVPALPVGSIDVTGAGDIFAGVFLAVFLNGGDVETAARLAAVGASQSTTGVGVNTVEITAKLVAEGLAKLVV